MSRINCFKLTILLACMILMACVQNKKTVGQSVDKQYRNPVITGMNPDPSICRVGDDFYLVTSTFEYFPGIPIYHSKDLVNWKQIGHVLNRSENCPLEGAFSSGGNYAPAIRYKNGTFYVTCTNYGGKGSQGAFYVTAENPVGPWSDPVWVGNWNVDPSIMFANDSMYWITPDNKGSFMVGTMNPANGKIIKPLQIVAAGLGGSSPEGPHMYHINNFYYLMSAEGGTGYEHREVMQRSKSPYGPFEPSPYNPVISNMAHPDSPFQAIGHADLVQLPDSSWWLVCLGIRPKGGKFNHLGRETYLAPVKWTDDGWPIAGTDGRMNENYPIPSLPIHVWDKMPVRDDFDAASLALCWNFLRNPKAEDWSLSHKPGCLSLYGSKVDINQQASPAFVGRRQSAFNMVASAKMSFTPTAGNEEAGLIVRGNDANHFDLVLTLKDGKRVVRLRKVLKDTKVVEHDCAIEEGDLVLRVSATDLEYKFWVQAEGEKAILLGAAPTKDLSTEKIGGFIGVYIGMYASGNGNPNVNPAEYDWFDYDEAQTPPYSWE